MPQRRGFTNFVCHNAKAATNKKDSERKRCLSLLIGLSGCGTRCRKSWQVAERDVAGCGTRCRTPVLKSGSKSLLYGKKTSIKGLYKRVLIKPFYIKLAAFEKAAVLYIKSKRKEKRKDLFFPLFWLDYLSPEIPRLPPGLSAYDTKLFLNIPNKGLRARIISKNPTNSGMYLERNHLL
jgi:hypothetical protein